MLDNIGQPEEKMAIVKRHVKAVSKAKVTGSRNLRKSNKLLSEIIPLGRQALKQLSPAHDDLKADLHLLFEDGETHLRNQNHAVG